MSLAFASDVVSVARFAQQISVCELAGVLSSLFEACEFLHICSLILGGLKKEPAYVCMAYTTAAWDEQQSFTLCFLLQVFAGLLW
jgi:hypothetical protein